MSAYQVLCLLFVLLSTSLWVNALDRSSLAVQRYMAMNAPEVKVSGTEAFLDQRLDHFTPLSTTFKQRYYVLDTYWNASQPLGPVILYIGGEGELSSNEIFNGFQAELAQNISGLLVGLEHRYYGQSIPVPDLQTTNLQYLSSHQGLEDLAFFREFITQTYNLSETAQWIVMGCSYPGNLAAWFRSRFPFLNVASLSGSSPVEAKADFWEYDYQVGLSAGDVCANKLRQATAAIEEQVFNSTTTNQAIKAKFTCDAISDNVWFFYAIADAAAFAIQYGMKAELCDNRLVPANTTDQIVDAYADYVKYLFNYLGTDCYNFTLSANSTVATPSANARQWFYQSCTEFGYFQVAPANNPVRSKYITLDWHRQACANFFGMDLFPDTNATNNFYGGKNISTTRTIFSNGAVDPWHWLSVTKNLSSTVQAFVIPGAAHCANFGPTRATTASAVVQAKQQIAGMLMCFASGGVCPAGCNLCKFDCTCGDDTGLSSAIIIGIIVGAVTGGIIVAVTIGVVTYRNVRKNYQTI